MVNPLLTILFDIALISAALLVAGFIIAEALAERRESIGKVHRERLVRGDYREQPRSAGRLRSGRGGSAPVRLA